MDVYQNLRDPILGVYEESPMERELNVVLNKFYQEISCPASNEQLECLKSVVHRILAKVEKIDQRFHFDINSVGSLASGVSAIVASEFDVLLILDVDGVDEMSQLSPGFAKFKLSQSGAKVWCDAVHGEYLIPGKLTDFFKVRVQTVVASMKEELEGSYEVENYGSATTVSAKVDGFKYKADLMVAVKCKGWPSSANADWLEPGYAKPWPSQDTIALIKSNGYELVPKNIFENQPGIHDKKSDLALLWRLSVSRSETLLLKTLEGAGCYKKLLIIAKALRLYFLTESVKGGESEYPEKITVPFSSYLLKTLLFHQAKKHPSPSEWTENRLAERFNSFWCDFKWRLMIAGMPTFFVPNVSSTKTHALFSGGPYVPLVELLIKIPKEYIESLLPFDKSKIAVCSYYNSL